MLGGGSMKVGSAVSLSGSIVSPFTLRSVCVPVSCVVVLLVPCVVDCAVLLLLLEEEDDEFCVDVGASDVSSFRTVRTRFCTSELSVPHLPM